MKRQKSQQGFTLIELLIVVAIIGILAAIAIPNLLTAMQRAKQKRTMADMRAIATAWEARAVDSNTYSAAGQGGPDGNQGVPPPSETTVISASGLGTMLIPTYIKSLPSTDGWGTPYIFALDDGVTANQYAILSLGKDRALQGTGYTPGTQTNDFDCDIVYSGGSFIQWPEGLQTSSSSNSTTPTSPPPGVT